MKISLVEIAFIAALLFLIAVFFYALSFVLSVGKMLDREESEAEDEKQRKALDKVSPTGFRTVWPEPRLSEAEWFDYLHRECAKSRN